MLLKQATFQILLLSVIKVMTKKNIILLSLAIVSFLSIKFQCGRGLEPRPFEHTFEAPVDIFPLKKTYSLIDTIWLETDIPGKVLLDTKTGQNVIADTGKITLRASFNEFGTRITSPANGFCDVITANGLNTDRILFQWGASGSFENYGCGQSNYKGRVGFKPNYKGTYFLSLEKEQLLESCANKVIPYYSTISLKYKSVDLNKDLLESVPVNDIGGNNGRNFYSNEINNRKLFVFRVE